MGSLTVCGLLRCGVTFVIIYFLHTPISNHIYSSLKPEGGPGTRDPRLGINRLEPQIETPQLGPPIDWIIGSPIAKAPAVRLHQPEMRSTNATARIGIRCLENDQICYDKKHPGQWATPRPQSPGEWIVPSCRVCRDPYRTRVMRAGTENVSSVNASPSDRDDAIVIAPKR